MVYKHVVYTAYGQMRWMFPHLGYEAPLLLLNVLFKIAFQLKGVIGFTAQLL